MLNKPCIPVKNSMWLWSYVYGAEFDLHILCLGRMLWLHPTHLSFSSYTISSTSLK